MRKVSEAGILEACALSCGLRVNVSGSSTTGQGDVSYQGLAREVWARRGLHGE